jgi:hypothetical protein
MREWPAKSPAIPPTIPATRPPAARAAFIEAAATRKVATRVLKEGIFTLGLVDKWWKDTVNVIEK